MVHLSITDFRLSIDLVFAANLVSSPKEKIIRLNCLTPSSIKNLLVLSSDVAVQGYILLSSIYLDYLSFLILKNRTLRQLEAYGDNIFCDNVVLFQIILQLSGTV